MPADFLATDTNFPTFTAETTTEDKVTSLHNYVYLLVEQLRYSLFNLDTRNFSPTAIDRITGPVTARIEDTEGRLAEMLVTAQGLQSRVSDAEGNISSLTQTAGGLQSTVSDLQGNVSAVTQTVNGLTVTDLYGTTYLNGAMLRTGTVLADKLRGYSVDLLGGMDENVGSLTLTGASSSDIAIELESYGALRLVSDYGAIYLSCSQYPYSASLQISYSSLLGRMAITCGADTVPSSESRYLGAGSLRWAALYAVTGSIQTSDRQKKNSISYDISDYEALFDRLKPVSYRFNDGTSGRTHIGFISQDVEESLAECGMTATDFAGFCRDGDDYALRYDEFIALNTAEIQKLKARISALEGENE